MLNSSDYNIIMLNVNVNVVLKIVLTVELLNVGRVRVLGVCVAVMC